VKRLGRAAADRLLSECSCWDDFHRRASALPTKADKGAFFERLVELYLQSAPAYVSTLRQVWRLENVPGEVRGRLRLPGPDEGIDLVARTDDDAYWAIQSKYLSSPDATLTRRGGLATFAQLAFQHCRGITLGVVAHTSGRPIRKLSLLGAVTEIPLASWAALDQEAWSRIHALASNQAARPAPREPKAHQQRAIDDARRHFIEQRHARGRLIMPCGTGKTLTAFWITHLLGGDSVLVALPSLGLVKQTVDDWAREWVAVGERPHFTLVCSDQTAGQLEEDSFVSQAYELGLPNFTTPAEVAARLTAYRGQRHVVFTTYQSSRVLAEAARLAGVTFDVGVLDEAHKTVGEVSKPFATLLDDRRIRIVRRVFMTATERILRGEDDDVLSMDDPAVYGERFHLYTFKNAIDEGVISDYRILTVSVSERTLAQYAAGNRLLTLSADDDALKAREATALAAGVALRRAFQQHGVTHAVSFHRSIRAARQFCEQQDALGKAGGGISNLHVSSKVHTGERRERLRAFASMPRALITNARCLTEGIDVPAIDCVVFADPKASTVDIVQATGRALRPAKGKRLGFVLVPFIVPDGESLTEFAKRTAYRHVVRVVAALSTQDDRIAEEFRLIAAGRKPETGILQIEGDVPVGIHLDAESFADAVRLTLWQRVGRANWRPFGDARQFVHSLEFHNTLDWKSYSASKRRPPDIPAAPDLYYPEFIDWGDWLGTGTIAPQKREYLPFVEARALLLSQNIQSSVAFRRWCAEKLRPPSIPSNPEQVYQEWPGWNAFLETIPQIPARGWRSFPEAREFARGLNLSSQTAWRQFAGTARRPLDVPKAPQFAYRREWEGWPDWLGTGRRWGKWRPFDQALVYSRGLGLKSTSEWRAFAKPGQLPQDIPADPQKVYANAWINWHHWLGTPSRRPPSGWRPFPKARAFVHGLMLTSLRDWQTYAKSESRPRDIPSHPESVYRTDWRGWSDWLNTIPGR